MAFSLSGEHSGMLRPLTPSPTFLRLDAGALITLACYWIIACAFVHGIWTQRAHDQ